MSALLSVLAVVVTAIVFVWAARVVCTFVSAGLVEPRPRSSLDDEPPEDAEIDNRSLGARLDAHLHELEDASCADEKRDALRGIANMGTSVLDPLTERLNPSDHLCSAACAVIHFMGLNVLQHLLSITKDDHATPRVRLGAVTGLWCLAMRRGSAEAFAELRRLELEDDNADVVYWAGAWLNLISAASLGEGHALESESGGEGRAPTTD